MHVKLHVHFVGEAYTGWTIWQMMQSLTIFKAIDANKV